jgi:hypothetical protein
MNDDSKSYLEFWEGLGPNQLGYLGLGTMGALSRFLADNRLQEQDQRNLDRIFDYMKAHDIPCREPEGLKLLVRLVVAEVRIIR